MSNGINIEDIMDELLDLDSFQVLDDQGRTLQESKKGIEGKHNMIKNVWIAPKSALQFITCKLNIVPTGAIQLKDLET